MKCAAGSGGFSSGLSPLCSFQIPPTGTAEYPGSELLFLFSYTRGLLFHDGCLAGAAVLADPPLGVLFEWFIGLRRRLCLFSVIAALGLFSFLTLFTVWSTSILTRRHIISSGFPSVQNHKSPIVVQQRC
jgi:hypothetical protein